MNDLLQVLGVEISPLTSYGKAIERVETIIRNRHKGFAVAINPEKIQAAARDDSLRELLNSADLKLCDGIGAAMAVRLLYGRKIKRVTGIGLFFELIRAAADRAVEGLLVRGVGEGE